MDVYHFLESPWVNSINQRLNPFTVTLIGKMAVEHLKVGSRQSILDICSGLGARRRLFPDARYVGVDINPDYIAHANRRYGSGFQVMDAGHLNYPADSFVHSLSCAVCHHLDDETTAAVVRAALHIGKPTGALHIIDAILPVSCPASLKQFFFQNDRGRHQRTLRQMVSLLAKAGRVADMDLRRGCLHDVCYFRITRAAHAEPECVDSADADMPAGISV